MTCNHPITIVSCVYSFIQSLSCVINLSPSCVITLSPSYYLVIFKAIWSPDYNLHQLQSACHANRQQLPDISMLLSGLQYKHAISS